MQRTPGRLRAENTDDSKPSSAREGDRNTDEIGVNRCVLALRNTDSFLPI